MQGSMQGGPARELQIPRQMNDLDHAITQVEKSISVLRDRITSVLPQSAGPIGRQDAKVPVPEPVCVPLANQIRELRGRVDAIAASVETMTGEVEL